jgi:hypothetical protein
LNYFRRAFPWYLLDRTKQGRRIDRTQRRAG